MFGTVDIRVGLQLVIWSCGLEGAECILWTLPLGGNGAVHGPGLVMSALNSRFSADSSIKIFNKCWASSEAMKLWNRGGSRPSARGNEGLEPPMRYRGKAPVRGSEGLLKLTTLSYFKDYFLTKLSHKFVIFRLYSEHGSTSAPAYNGEWDETIFPFAGGGAKVHGKTGCGAMAGFSPHPTGSALDSLDCIPILWSGIRRTLQSI